jgi:class 3 adenylate cyclase
MHSIADGECFDAVGRRAEIPCQNPVFAVYSPLMGASRDIGILFADISGSTRIYEALGDQRAHSIVEQALRIVAGPVTSEGGSVVKTIGDELMAAFPTPAATLHAAIDIQKRINELPPLPFGDGDMRIAMRIGFHFGPAVEQAEDFFGDSVNVAARVVGLAKANQILTTGEVLDLLEPADAARLIEFGRIDVRGRTGPVRVARVEWEEQRQSTTVLRFAGTPDEPEREANLRLVFEGRNWQVPPSMRSISCGRDELSNLVLKGPQVSRAHATIERRRGKVFLIDHSTNGTFLVIENQQPIKLHREEFGLVNHGHIVFGAVDDEGVDNLWYYIS